MSPTRCKCCFPSSLSLHFVILLFVSLFLYFLSPTVTYMRAETISDLFSTRTPYLTRCVAYGKCLINPCRVKGSIFPEHKPSPSVLSVAPLGACQGPTSCMRVTGDWWWRPDSRPGPLASELTFQQRECGPPALVPHGSAPEGWAPA